MTYADPTVQATLDWCNERRVENGQPTIAELPMGVREDPKSCPCGAATGLHVDLDYWCKVEDYHVLSTDDSKRHDLPTEVETFVSMFDAGEYPEFDANEGEVLSG